MKKFLFPAFALGLLMTSCQSDEPMMNGLGEEQQVSFTVSLPDAVSTRAGGTNSAAGGVSNNVGANVTFNVALYLDGRLVYADNETVLSTGNHTSATFEPTLVIGENYQLVAFAEFDGDATATGEGVNPATNMGLIAMESGINNELNDEYFVSTTLTAAPELSATLKRPYGKLRLIAEDLAEAERQFGAKVESVEVTYKHTRPTNFNVIAGTFDPAYTEVAQTFTAAYGEYSNETDAARTIFVDYLPGKFDGSESMVPFTVTVKFEGGKTYTRSFTQDIPVRRNWLTTLKGRLFTIDSDLTLTIEENFDGETETNFANDLEWVAANGGTVNLTQDITLTETLNVTKDMVINLNGKTITGTMHKSVGAVIKVAEGASLRVIGGTISSTADNGGSAIQNNGTLEIEKVTLNGAPNANGSWPSYTVNNTGTMTAENAKITSYHGAVASYGDGAVVTLNDCEIDMAGIPGFTSHGIYTYNNGKVIVNGGIYANKATDQASSGASVINGAVEVNAGTFTGRIENYYGTPVLKGGSYTVEPKASFIAAGYKAIKNGDKYYVVPEEADAVATTTSELNDALANGDDVVLFSDIAVAKSDAGSNGYGATGISQLNGGVIDGNGNDLSVNAWGTWDSALNTTGGTIKNLNVTGGMRGIFVNHNSTNNSKVILENVVIDGTVYTISCDQGTNQGLEAYNSTFNGWTSYAATIGDVMFKNCSFGEGQGYAYCRPYAPTKFVGCEFEAGYVIDARAKVIFENCTLGGVALTADNLSTLVTSNIANATVK